MKDFIYKNLTFSPYRNTTEEESADLYKHLTSWDQIPFKFNYREFYEAAKAADPENEVDLFLCNGEIVIPAGDRLFLFKDFNMPEHYCREQDRPLPAGSSAAFSTLLAVMDETGKDGFYPTPPDLATEMAQQINLDFVHTVLEPSAGKGDLVDALVNRDKIHNYQRCTLDVDCIELNPDLRLILKGKGYRVVHDDFMTFDTFKRYDAIIMNPPFRDGERHLMKALDLLKDGGQIVCLLNAETLRNLCTPVRRELRERLEQIDTKITYYKDRFADAQRKTDVSIAMVCARVPAQQRSSDFYDRMQKADEVKHDGIKVEAMAPDDFIERITRQFKIEISAGMELIRQYDALKPYMLDEIIPEGQKASGYPSPILSLGVKNSYLMERSKDSSMVNQYVRQTRYKYWSAFLNNQEFVGKLTSDMQKQWQQRVDDLSNYDFTPFNIQTVMVEMNAQIFHGVEDSIMKIFEQLTAEHAWYPECAKNIHYYNGWAHNKAHKINGKVIIPSYGVFSDWKWDSDTFRVREAYDHLADIERCFNYLDGHTTADIDLYGALSRANDAGITKNIPCKFFEVTFYKKGTTHIKFTNPRLLDKFNIYCSRKRGWLPPAYGRRRYEDMGAEEKAVVDDFQGKAAYEEVLKDTAWYLPETSSLLSLPSAG